MDTICVKHLAQCLAQKEGSTNVVAFLSSTGWKWSLLKPIHILLPYLQGNDCDHEKKCAGQLVLNRCVSVCVCLVTELCLTLVTSWTVAGQVPLSMGFPRQQYWSGQPFPYPYVNVANAECLTTLLNQTHLILQGLLISNLWSCPPSH